MKAPPEQTAEPKLRDVEAQPINHEGQAMILLRDPLHLSQATIAVPRPLAPLLALMDGTRDEAALEAALRVRTGVRLAPGLLARLVADLDEACLLDNERSAAARAGALRRYREASCRPATLYGSGFPREPERASALLQGYVDALPPATREYEPPPTRGVISPHIDYERGGPVYAQVWRAAAGAAREADLVIMLGTDHAGSAGSLTPTRQSYATPWGTLPTDLEIVDALVEILGTENAYREELHHRGEHSIELAAVWLHFIRAGNPVPVVPILCGHFGAFVAGIADPAQHEPFHNMVALLQPLLTERRALVVAAADLAHVGPAFGAAHGLDFVARAQLRSADERLLSSIYDGDALGFFSQLKDERDRRNVCGLPPIYLTLRLLDNAQGEPAGYDLCPADAQGLSFVTIAGVILH